MIEALVHPIQTGRLARWRWKHGHYWFLRRSHKRMPLRIYAGLPGSGKTLFAVQDAIKLLRAGERVYSNIYIKDPLTGAESLPCLNWMEMLSIAVDCLEEDARRRDEGLPPLGAYFVWDELHEYCDAREWAATPKWVRKIFTERRHYRIALLGTTQIVEQLEKRLRTLVDEIWDVRPTPMRVIAQEHMGRELPLFLRSVVDRRMVDHPELTVDVKRHWRLARVGWEAFGGYGTHEHVTTQGVESLNDPRALEVVEALRARAAAVMLPDHIESFDERSRSGRGSDDSFGSSVAVELSPGVGVENVEDA